MTINIDNYVEKPLKDWAWRVDKSGDNQHYGSGVNIIHKDGTIDYMMGYGGFGKDNCYVVEPPLNEMSRVAWNMELQISLKQLDKPITLEALQAMTIRVYDNQTQRALYDLAKRSHDMTVEESIVLDQYINREPKS